MGLSVGKLEHWTLVTKDVGQSKRFYTQVLNATEVDREWPPAVALGNTQIDLFTANDEQQPEPGSTGQHHAYHIELDDYDQWVDHIRSKGVQPFLAHHGARRLSIYVDDPDGYHIELTAAAESDEQGRQEIEKRGIGRYTNSAGPQGRGLD